MAAVRVCRVSAGWLLCVSQVAGVHVVIECKPGGWSTCGYCVSARWLEYMWLLCASRVAGVARGMVGRCMHFSHVDVRQIVP